MNKTGYYPESETREMEVGDTFMVNEEIPCIIYNGEFYGENGTLVAGDVIIFKNDLTDDDGNRYWVFFCRTTFMLRKGSYIMIIPTQIPYRSITNH